MPEGVDPLGARDRGISVYVISVAARLSGLHPQTLRNYEREGLIEPTRSQGGNRMYSDADLDRLQAIADLTDAGLNIAGIRMVLALQAENDTLRAQLEAAEGALPD